MSLIYEPRGKAREYSPLALNIYSGCGHKCVYCYVPNVLSMDRQKFDSGANTRRDIIKNLKNDAKKHFGTDKQVLLCFTTDPYNPINDELKVTREVLQILLNNKIPVAILTKGGKRCLQDMDIFKQFGSHIKVGASLTYDNDLDSLRVEKGAATPGERMEALKTLKDNGIKTWVSFEPILMSKQTINMVEYLIETDGVDEFQFGKLADESRPMNWVDIVNSFVPQLRKANKPFYIKKTLQAATPNFKYNPNEVKMDYLTLDKFAGQEGLGL